MGDFLGALILVVVLPLLTVFIIVFFFTALLAPVWIGENYFKYECETWSFSDLRDPNSCLTPRLKGEDDE